MRRGMDHAQHNTIVNFIWSIADDVLRDVYVRGKYPDDIETLKKETKGILHSILLESGGN